MPANSALPDIKDLYFHIYNKGVGGKQIFNEDRDYHIFLDYLKDYLTAANPESTKKKFTVKGRIFSGVPHQLNNYLGKIELIAYRLEPDHFHLLLHQIATWSVENFIRSLCTRYSKYFNKKYQRTGTLFEGPYKSVQIEDVSHLYLLTRHFHSRSKYSSYPEYLHSRKSVWIKTMKGTEKHREFVEKYVPSQEDNQVLKTIAFDIGTCSVVSPPKEKEQSIIIPTKPRSRILEFASISAVFLVLLGLGIRNINASAIKTVVLSDSTETKDIVPTTTSTEIPSYSVAATPVSTPEASPTPEITPTPTETAEAKTMVIVNISDGSPSVNIRQNPTIKSEAIGKAQDGETFELVSVTSGWYEIKLADGSSGFISPKYAVIEGTKI